MKITDTNYQLPIIEAVALSNEMISGTTHPISVRGLNPTTGERGQFILKWRNSNRMSPKSITNELLGAWIAIELGIHCVTPVVINLSELFVQKVMFGREGYKSAQNSIGINFGSVYEEGLFQLTNQIQPENNKLIQQAMMIFMFDLFVENADRGQANNNLFYKENKLFIVDHELIFSFLDTIFQTPLELLHTDSELFKHHPLLPILRSCNPDIERCINQLTKINSNFWNAVTTHLPEEFNSESVEKIQTRLDHIVSKKRDFCRTNIYNITIMKPYQYQIIKYVHDHFTGEFVNIGVVVFEPESQYLQCTVSTKSKRITDMFPKADGKAVVQSLRYFKEQLTKKSNELKGIYKPSISLSEITSQIIPIDNSTIQYSKVNIALDIDFDAALSDLYKEMVDKYTNQKQSTSTPSDEAIWRQKYKKFFKEAGIIKKLKPHSISTPNDEFVFSKSWKNDIWHSYEPLSLEQKDMEDIKSKVYIWAGKLKGIKQSDEKMSITLLSSLNKEHQDLKPFVEEYLVDQSNDVKIDIVYEDQIVEFVAKVKEEMRIHEEHEQPLFSK